MATRKTNQDKKPTGAKASKSADSKKDKKLNKEFEEKEMTDQKATDPEEDSENSTGKQAEGAADNHDTDAATEPTVEEKLSEMQDKYMRLSAEFDNYRKRTLKEKMDLTKTAGESILFNLLPVMDDFDRAMNLMDSATDCKSMKEGIDLIYSKFQDFFRQNGVKEIESKNSEFDTDLHEAVTKIPAPEKKLRGKVVDVIQKGYFLNDKVMRHSKVVIGE